MSRVPLPSIAIVLLVLLAGCLGFGGGTAGPSPTATPHVTPAAVDTYLVSSTTTGGRCVAHASPSLDVRGHRAKGVLTLEVTGNATAAAANDVVSNTTVTRTGDGSFRLDVNTSADPAKPPKACPGGAVVHYDLVLTFPATNPFALKIRNDGTTVATF